MMMPSGRISRCTKRNKTETRLRAVGETRGHSLLSFVYPIFFVSLPTSRYPSPKHLLRFS